MTDILIHPAAQCFRLMRDEELADLAADIKANGLRDPITLAVVNGTATPFLVDGRNRLQACELAGVEAQFETRQFDTEEEVRAFVKSRGERRDLTKGEKAMAIAMLFPEPEKGGRGKKSAAIKSVETTGFSRSRLDQARAVYRYSVELATAVRDGVVSLDSALAKVKTEQDSLKTTETKLAELRVNAPDLADLVDEERMSLGEAIAAASERVEEAKRVRHTYTEKMQTILNLLDRPNFNADDIATSFVENYDPDDPTVVGEPMTSNRIDRCIRTLQCLKTKIEG